MSEIDVVVQLNKEKRREEKIVREREREKRKDVYVNWHASSKKKGNVRM